MVFITPLAINLLAFKVNSVDNSSVINAGANQYIDQFTSYKRNQSFGELNGDLSPVTVPITNILDTDLLDSPTTKNSVF